MNEGVYGEAVFERADAIRDRGTSKCPKCGHLQTEAEVRGVVYIFYRCSECGHGWDRKNPDWEVDDDG